MVSKTSLQYINDELSSFQLKEEQTIRVLFSNIVFYNVFHFISSTINVSFFLPKDITSEFYAVWKEVNCFLLLDPHRKDWLVYNKMISDLIIRACCILGNQSGTFWLGEQFAPEATNPYGVPGWRELPQTQRAL